MLRPFSSRAIIFQGGWSTHVRSFDPSALGELERREKGDGSGDIILAKETHYTEGHYTGGHYTGGYYSCTPGRGGHYVPGSWVPGSWVPGRWSTKEIGLFGIPQVKHVEQLLRELAARQKEAGGRRPASVRSPTMSPKAVRFSLVLVIAGLVVLFLFLLLSSRR